MARRAASAAEAWAAARRARTESTTRPAMKWFMAAALSVFAFLAMARSVVAPVITGPSRLEYLFLAPSRIELLWLAAGAAALTLALRVWAIGMKRPLRDGRWMAPLCLLALSLAPLAAFLPGFARFGSPFVFIGHDMRWWLLAVSLALTARELNARLGGALAA